MDDDDDAPPPLSSLSEQVEALKLRAGSADAASTSADALRVASAVLVPDKSAASGAKDAAAPALKKGFFDSKPAKQPKRKPAAPKDPEIEEIPVIKANKSAMGGPQIPDFLRLPPDEEAQKYEAYKQQLAEKLKPTPDMISQVTANPQLSSAFDDPEVMAAVSDVANNPKNFAKYKNNPKVVQFYAMMGKMMGDKLDKEGM